MLTPQVVANTVLMLAFEENIAVSPMKLQKLIYIIYKTYLKKTGNKLFTESFSKWKYGPVVESVYYEFGCFGANSINKFARDAKGNVQVIDLEKKSLLSEIVQDVWDKYKGYSAMVLSSLTHSENSAWSKAVEENRNTLKDEDIKNEEDF